MLYYLLPLVTYAAPIAAPGTPAGPVADMLRLNLGVTATPPDSASRLGLIAGDAAGYPVTLSQPGSYRLTSNLVQPGATTSVLRATANNVSIDLGGFTVEGPVSCTGSGSALICSPSGAGLGIHAGGRARTRT